MGISGGPASAWRGSGDAGELLCASPTSRRTPPAGSKPWGGKEGQGGHPAVGCEAAKGRRLQVVPSPEKPAIGRAPRTPNSLPTAGRDAAASSAASPSIPGTPWPSLPGAGASLCIFLPSGPAPGTGSLQPRGAARWDCGDFPHPEAWGNQTKRTEKKGKGRRGVERRGRCQQAASSHLLPARGLQGPPSSVPDGDNAGGGTHTHARHSAVASPT